MTTGTTVTGESSGCVGTLKVTNAWQNASTAGYPLDISMKNNSGAEKQGWKLVLTFTGTVSVDQIWNGTTQVQGSTLVISPVDWNTNVASGSEVTAGMIVTTSYDFAITGVTVQ